MNTHTHTDSQTDGEEWCTCIIFMHRLSRLHVLPTNQF